MRPLLAAVALVTGASGCRPHHSHPGGPDGIDARALFHTTCAQCHGDDGRAQTEAGRAAGARDLTRDETRRMSGEAIAHQIKVGGGKMPAFGTLLDDAEIDALAAHVRVLRRPHKE